MKTQRSIESVAVVIPCYHSQSMIRTSVETIRSTLIDRWRVEFILVNDGSTDGTWDELVSIHADIPNVTIVNLRRNFGEHNAVLTGLRMVNSDIAIVVDDDLQHPPSEMVKLITKMADGYDVVYGRYIDKRHSLLRNIGSKLNDIAATWLMGKPRSLYLSSFKAIDRAVCESLAQFDSPFVYLDGIIFWLTDRVAQVDVDHHDRADGHSNYTMTRLLRLHLNMLTSFSILPLRLASITGIIVALLGGIMAVVFVIEKLRRPELPVGWASTIICILLWAGMSFVMLGIIGEYVGRLFVVVNRRPQAVIRDLMRPSSHATDAKSDE